MCLITTQQEPFIAQEDLITYKVLRHNLQSHFYKSNPFIYTFNELNEIDILPSESWTPFSDADDEWISKHIGYETDSIFMFKRECEKTDLKCFGQGFHSALTLETLSESINTHWVKSQCSVFECTIPKGSQYYVNTINLVISNKIIINKQVS